jgi:hypothetical protein
MMEPKGFAMPNPPRTSRSSCSRVKPSFAHAHVPLKHVWHTRVTSCRTAVLGCIEALPSSSRLTAAFAPQFLLPTCRAISASPPPRGSRELTASSRHLHTLASCRQLALLMLWHRPRRAHSLRLRSPAPL